MSEPRWKEQLREEKQAKRQEFKNLTGKQKAGYIWDYYRLIIIGSLIGLILAGSILYTVLKPKPEYALNLVLVNSNIYMGEEIAILNDYEKEAGLEKNGAGLNVNTNIHLSQDMQSQTDAANFQLLSILLMTKEMDLFLADQAIFESIGGSGGFYEIADILDEELAEKYKDALITIADPETGKKYICGIRLPEDNALVKDNIYSDAPIAGILNGTENTAEAVSLLLFLLGE